MKLEKVEIIWIDSKGITPSWEYRDELEYLKPTIVTSICYLLEDATEYKTIAQSVSADQTLGRTTIPVISIKNIRKIRYLLAFFLFIRCLSQGWSGNRPNRLAFWGSKQFTGLWGYFSGSFLVPCHFCVSFHKKVAFTIKISIYVLSQVKMVA